MTPDDAPSTPSPSSSSGGSAAPKTVKPAAAAKAAAATPSPSPDAGAEPTKPAKPVKTEKAATVAKREAAKKVKEEEKEGELPRAPKRATLEADERRLLALRRSIDRRRPLFVRTASHRYTRIGRWNSWRRPRGLQSKQRRHYGYRPVVVSIGFRTPAAIRGLTPTGFEPIRVTNLQQLEGLEPKRQCAVIAHGVGVRKRLVLEEAARKKGVHVVNPILKEEVET